MRLQEVIPYMVCVNLAAREDRRREAWGRFAAAGLAVDRQPGILKRTVSDPRGFRDAARYSCSLAKRLAIRRAKLAGAPAVLLFEDDVVLAADLHERLAEIELPEDWGIFFLGCKHLERPEIIAPGLVKVTRAADHHAMAIRADFFDAAIRGLAGYGKGSPYRINYSDVKMSEIQAWVPTYAAFPNLAWQALSHSDNAGSRQTHYDSQGRQKTDLHAVQGLDAEMKRWRTAGQMPVRENEKEEVLPVRDEVPSVDSPASAEGGEVPAPVEGVSVPLDVSSAVSPSDCEAGETPGLLEGALPTGGAPEAVSVPAAPRVWTAADNEPPGYHYVPRGLPCQPLEESFPLRLYINLGRREDRRAEAEYQFALQDLEVERLPAADGRWVTKTRGHGPPNKYACRLSHRLALRTARQRGAPAVLIFEDDVILHPQFRRIAEALPPPADWGVLFFGCTHVEAPQAVAPGWVRAKHILCDDD
jgi:hypothetical protein